MTMSSEQVTAAIIAGAVSLVVAVISAVITVVIANRRARVDEKLAKARGNVDHDLAELQAKFAKELTEQKDRLDNRTIFAAEQVVRELMMDSEWNWRSFKIIQHHLGGFAEDELRKILVRAGAIRVTAKNGDELWGLLDRNRDYIGVERLSVDLTNRTRLSEDGTQVVVEAFESS